jgi:hypothetical protein
MVQEASRTCESMTAIDLRIDPLDFVGNLETPIGVYLRREVLGKKEDAKLRKRLHEKIASKQSDDGSWDQLFVHTANNLWDLALLGYGARDKSVKKGLDWLLTTQTHTYHDHPGFFYSPNRRDPSLMRETSYGEFGPGCTIFYQTPYAVHLFHVLGLDDREEVQQTVKSYLKFWTPTWCGSWCTINVLRMLIEHPRSASSKRGGRAEIPGGPPDQDWGLEELSLLPHVPGHFEGEIQGCGNANRERPALRDQKAEQGRELGEEGQGEQYVPHTRRIRERGNPLGAPKFLA